MDIFKWRDKIDDRLKKAGAQPIRSFYWQNMERGTLWNVQLSTELGDFTASNRQLLLALNEVEHQLGEKLKTRVRKADA